MSAPQPPRPAPPEGFDTWFDYLMDDCDAPPSRIAMARAELAELRKELEEVSANHRELSSVYSDAEEECADLRKELSDTKRHLDYVEGFAKAEGIKHIDRLRELNDTKAQLALQAANTVEAMQQRDAAQAERDEATGQLDDISSVSGHGLMLDDADHEAPRLPDWIDGIVKERDSLRAQVAELRGAVLGLGELRYEGEDVGVVLCYRLNGEEMDRWNAIFAKLRSASPAGPEESKQ